MSNKKNVDYNPLSIDEDFYIPPREVKPREFSQEQEDKDIAYLRKIIYESLEIPKEYLEENEEWKFAAISAILKQKSTKSS